MSLVFKSGSVKREILCDPVCTLADLAAEAGFPLNLQCGGQGNCRRCTVVLCEGHFRIGNDDVSVKKPVEARACKTTVLSESATVEIPGRSLLTPGKCPAGDFFVSRKNLFIARDDVVGQLGIAVDIGTTTVVLLLVDLSTGDVLARASAYNRQTELGTDISSRIARCADIDEVERLQTLLIFGTLVPMFRDLECADIASSPDARILDRVTQIVFSGNTVMSHLALGLSPLSIGTLPFEPLTKVYSRHIAPALGLTCCPAACIRTVPSVAGYVGGDVVCDLYVSEMRCDRLELLVDIGTNGEIVLNDHGTLLATATAAGPAFEGAGLLHGTCAGPGVINHILCRADDSIEYQVIGDLPARGLCGSAAVDFIATALNSGLLNEVGRFNLDRLTAANRFRALDCHGIIVNACILTEESSSGEPVMITEFDVSQILKAKGAVYAGIRTLLAEAGYKPGDVERLVLAGGFAAHLRIDHAINMGLLPELPLEVYDVVGNGSLAGAYAALGSPKVFDELLDLAEQPSALHLNQCAEFNDRYIDAMALPNLNADEFPGMKKNTL